MVNTYKNNVSMDVSKWFRAEDFKCECGKCQFFYLDDRLPYLLDKIADRFGKPEIVQGFICTHCIKENQELLDTYENIRPLLLGTGVVINGIPKKTELNQEYLMYCRRLINGLGVIITDAGVNFHLFFSDKEYEYYKRKEK